MFRFGLYFILLAFVFGCSGAYQESEPNNNRKEAQSVSLPAQIEGQLDHGADEDYYQFELEEAAHLAFTISSVKGFDVMLEIGEISGKGLKLVDDYLKNFGESLPNIYLKPGNYYVKVSPGLNDHRIERPKVIASEPYQLEILHLSTLIEKENFGLEEEPNDILEQAQELRDGLKIKGFFNAFLNQMPITEMTQLLLGQTQETTSKDFRGKDLDFYQFTISERGSFLLQMELTSVKDVDSTIVVVDQRYLQFLRLSPEEREARRRAVALEELGTYFVIDSNGFDKGEGVANYRIPGNNRYFIMIGAMNRLNYESLAGMAAHPYYLSYRLLPLTSDMEAEPNNTVQNASKIENNVVRGFLNPINDLDYYYLEGNEESFYRLNFKENNVNTQITRYYKLAEVTVIPPKNVDLALYIYDEDGKLAKRIDNQEAGGVEKMPNLLVPFNRKTLFMVKGGGKNDQDNYTTPYELKFFFNEKISEDFEHEPNDKEGQNKVANTFSESIRGYVNNFGDEDNYYIILQRGNHNFSLNSLPDMTFSLELYDANGFFVKRTVASGKGADVALDYFVPKRDVFRIKVFPMEKNVYNVEQTYTLSLETANSEEDE